jgi:SAM-dependent methyltransferase
VKIREFPDVLAYESSDNARMGSATVQGQLWNANPRDWANIHEPLQVPFYEAVLSALDLAPGMELLDAGCGAGLALVLARERGATVAGVDAATGLLELARERLPDADLREGDLEALPWDDEAFDVATAFNSVQYAADPVAALKEIRRTLRPGGRLGVVTWGQPEQCEMRDVFAATGSVLPPPPPGAAGPFALSTPGALEALLAEANFTTLRTGEVDTPYSYADLDVAWRSMACTGPGKRAIDHAGLDATKGAVMPVFEAHSDGDGVIRLSNVFRYVIGKK